MKTQSAQKVIAIFTAFSLAFLQAVPAGVAATKPVDQIDGASVSTSEKSAADNTAQPPATAPVPETQTSTGFLASSTTISRTTVTTPVVVPKPVLLPTRTPEAVQALVKRLQDRLGTGYVVSIPPYNILRKSYSISVVKKVTSSPLPQGGFQSMTVTVDAAASVLGVAAVYKGISGVNGKMLYDGVAQISGDPLVTMTRVAVKLNNIFSGTMAIQYENYQYKISKSKDGKVVITSVTPPAVTDFINKLKTGIGHYNVKGAWIQGTHPPRYQVSVADSAVYVKAPTTGLHTASFVLSGDGKLDEATLQASYYGIAGDIKVDGPLLFGALGSPDIFPFRIPAVEGYEFNLSLEILKRMTQINVTKIEAGAIYFSKDGKNYKTYRDATGKVIVEDLTAQEAVRVEILAKVEAEIAKVEAEIAAYEARLVIQLAAWEAAVAQLKADLAVGRADADSIRLSLESYLGQVGVSDELKAEIQTYLTKNGSLLEGLNVAEEQYASFLKMGARMTQFSISDAKAYLTALKDHQAKVAAAKTLAELKLLEQLPPRRRIFISTPPPVADPRIALNTLLAEGKLLKEKLDALPPLAVREYANQLQTQLDHGFLVKIDVSYPKCAEGIKCLGGVPEYRISVVDNKEYVSVPASGLKTMSFGFKTETACTNSIPGSCKTFYTMDPQSLQVAYYGAKEDIKVDAKLLFEAMGACPAGQVCTLQVVSDIEKLVRMTQISVTQVENGAIFFTKDGVNYKCFRDADGTVVLERELPPAVNQFVKQLRALFPWWKIDATRIPNSQPPQYQVVVGVRDGSLRVPALFQEGALRGLSFVVSENGRVIGFPNASYEGRQGVDSELLWRAIPQIISLVSPGLHIALPPPGSEWMIDATHIAKMMRVVVTSVESGGAILFSLEGKDYRAYRDATGEVKVVLETNVLPDGTVQYFDGLGRITKQERKDGSAIRYFYQGEEFMPSSVILVRPDGKEVRVEFERTEKGRVSFDVNLIEQVVIDLLGRGEEVSEIILKKYETGAGRCTMDIPVSSCSEMISLDLVSPSMIYHYGISRNWSERFGTDSYKIDKFSKTPVIPPAVQEYVDQLKASLPGSLGVHVRLIPDSVPPQYQVTIDHTVCTETKGVGKCVSSITEQGKLGSMSFNISSDGVMDASTLNVTYGVEGVDAQLLFGAAMQLADPCFGGKICTQNVVTVGESNRRAIVLMTQITVTKVEADAIFFSKDGVDYKCYRNATGQVTVEAVSPIRIPELPQLWAPPEAIVFPSTLKHYDVNNVLLREIVMDAEGKIVSVSTYIQGRDTEIPAKVEVYPQGSAQPYSVITYDANGQILSVTIGTPLSGDTSGNSITIIPINPGTGEISGSTGGLIGENVVVMDSVTNQGTVLGGATGGVIEATEPAVTRLADLPPATIQSVFSQFQYLQSARSRMRAPARIFAETQPFFAKTPSPVYEQASSLRSSPVFAFESGSVLIGRLLEELT